jgi:hypothetical protein
LIESSYIVIFQRVGSHWNERSPAFYVNGIYSRKKIYWLIFDFNDFIDGKTEESSDFTEYFFMSYDLFSYVNIFYYNVNNVYYLYDELSGIKIEHESAIYR